MPRAHRHFLPGHVWHITHRCHKKEFLLKFAKDRHHWRYWLFESRKRFGLSVLNYVITANHIHLLVRDRGCGEISKSIQLIAGRTAQEYNRRKNRNGAFWEDRYHATAVDSDTHLVRCMVYIDLNMVRAGVVKHPVDWVWSGYYEIQSPPKRYSVIDQQGLMELLNTDHYKQLQQLHKSWVETMLESPHHARDPVWSNSIAVGSLEYVDRIKVALGITGKYKQTTEANGSCVLREPLMPYK
jgi:putative transposase